MFLMLKKLAILFFSSLLFLNVQAAKCTCSGFDNDGGVPVCFVDSNNCGTNEICPCVELTKTSPYNCDGQELDCVAVDPSASTTGTCDCYYSGGCFDPLGDYDGADTNDNCNSGEICGCSSFTQSQCMLTSPCIAKANGAVGDPHFHGFDGNKFDFHGEHDHCYLVYSQKFSDVLVAKMRATNEIYKGIKKTYFKEFGLRVKSGHRIRIFMERNEVSKKWQLKVELNKKVISLRENHTVIDNVHFLHYSKTSSLTVITDENSFSFHGASMNSKNRHHIDFKMDKRNGNFDSSQKSSYFTGVLGMTMSRKLGSSVHNEVVKGKNVLAFEMEMRKHYEMPNIFPGKSVVNRVYSNLDSSVHHS